MNAYAWLGVAGYFGINLFVVHHVATKLITKIDQYEQKMASPIEPTHYDKEAMTEEISDLRAEMVIAFFLAMPCLWLAAFVVWPIERFSAWYANRIRAARKDGQ